MINIILIGCSGKMGGVLTGAIDRTDDMQVVAGVDKFHGVERKYPIYDTPFEIAERADVIIDFSNPDTTSAVIEYAVKNKIAAVIGTTGLNDSQTEQIIKASDTIPVFSSFNMSLGVNLLIELAKKAANILGNDFDIEIVEQHHNQKVDAPSGTAFMIAKAINETRNDTMQYKYDRHSTRAKREPNEIGIHSIRGGNIVGEHEIIFAGTDEVIKLSHSARSKEVFATGAVNAARFIYGKAAKLYSMKDIIE